MNYVKVNFPKVYHYLLKMIVYDFRMERLFFKDEVNCLRMLCDYNREIAEVQNGYKTYESASVMVKRYMCLYKKYVMYAYEMAEIVGRDKTLEYMDILENYTKSQVEKVFFENPHLFL